MRKTTRVVLEYCAALEREKNSWPAMDAWIVGATSKKAAQSPRSTGGGMVAVVASAAAFRRSTTHLPSDALAQIQYF